jgi:twinkle protein
MSLVERAIDRFNGIIEGKNIDWERYLEPSDISRVIPAEALADRVKRIISLGEDRTEGIALPWPRTHDKVFINSGKLCVWTGWSHHGKTAMLKQVMASAIYQGEKVCIASMEETVVDVWRDMAFICCGTSEPKLSELDRFVEFISEKLWLYDQEGSVNSKRIQAVIRYCAKELKVTQFVVDSLMMLQVSRDDYDAQAKFVGELKALAKDTNCTIHLVAHMRKKNDAKTGEEVPGSQHDIAGGHEIGSKADYVFNVWRDKKRKDPEKPEALLIVDKQRGRQNWIGKISLNHHKDSRQFTETQFPLRFWS